MKTALSVLPFISLAASLVSNFVTLGRVWGDILGYSLVTDLFMLLIVLKLRFCIYTRICVFGLIALNIVSLLGEVISYSDYSTIYDVTIIAITILMCGWFWLKNINLRA